MQVVGDLYSLATCNEIGCRRLIEMMDEFAIDDLDRLGKHILEKSQAGLARGDPQDHARHLQVTR